MRLEKLKKIREAFRVNNEVVTCEALADSVNKLLTFLEENGQSLNQRVLSDKRNRFKAAMSDINKERDKSNLASIDLSVIKTEFEKLEDECQVCLDQIQKTAQVVDEWLKKHPVRLIFRRSDFIKKP